MVDDAESLRGIAHPLRLRLLGQLRLRGPATASALGRELGESSGSTSYHLRQLERYGFVEPAPDQPSRRDKVWQACHISTEFRLPASGDREVWRTALGTVVDAQLAALIEGVRARQRDAARWPPAWEEAHMSDDVRLHLAPERLAALKKELQRVISTFEQSADASDAEARTVFLHLQSFAAPGEIPPPASGPQAGP